LSHQNHPLLRGYDISSERPDQRRPPCRTTREHAGTADHQHPADAGLPPAQRPLRKGPRQAEEHDAVWVDTPDYGINGGLGYYTRMANDPLPVFHSVAPFRYRWAPMPDELKDLPHLSIFNARSEQAPDREGLTYLARVTRDSKAGEPLGAFDVYLSK
jgi:hypothetical protein